MVYKGLLLADQVGTQHRRRHHALARLHPVVVALDRIDFAIVGDITIRMRQRPFGEGIGGEALVNERQRALEIRIVQVRIIGAELVGEEHALVDHGAA